MSTLDAPIEARPWRMTPRLALGDIGGVAHRNLLRIWRTPRLLVIGTLQPAILLILFRYVLGGAISIPGSTTSTSSSPPSSWRRPSSAA